MLLMAQATKIKFASLITALFLGGLAALGLATRPGSSETVAVAPATGRVIHKRKVKTVRVPSAPTATTQTAAPAAVPSVPVSSPAPVSSSVSPGGGSGSGYGGDEGEGGGEERD